MEAFSFNTDATTNQVDSFDQNSENSQSEIVIDSAACGICTPSMMIQPSNQEPEQEMQDAPGGSTRRKSTRARKVMSSSEDEMTMPLRRGRTASTASKRGGARKSARSRSTPRKASSTRKSSRSRSRPSSTRKRSVSRRGRRA